MPSFAQRLSSYSIKETVKTILSSGLKSREQANTIKAFLDKCNQKNIWSGIAIAIDANIYELIPLAIQHANDAQMRQIMKEHDMYFIDYIFRHNIKVPTGVSDYMANRPSEFETQIIQMIDNPNGVVNFDRFITILSRQYINKRSFADRVKSAFAQVSS